MRKLIYILLAIVIVGGGAWFIWNKNADTGTSSGENTSKQPIVYENAAHDLNFTYAPQFFLTEKEVGNAERGHYSIVIMEDTKENRDLGKAEQPPREGPPAITIDVFQNDIDKMSVDEFVKNTNDSNFKISPDGQIASTTVAQLPAQMYRIDGLYPGYATVIATDKFVYLFTGTYMNQNDKILDEYAALLGTVEIQ